MQPSPAGPLITMPLWLLPLINTQMVTEHYRTRTTMKVEMPRTTTYVCVAGIHKRMASAAWNVRSAAAHWMMDISRHLA